MNTFQQLGLEDHLLQAIKDLGFETQVKYNKKQFQHSFLKKMIL